MRTDAPGPVNAPGASYRGLAVHRCFSNDRGSIRSRTAGAIYTIGAHDGVGLVRRNEPANYYDSSPDEFPHVYLQSPERDYAAVFVSHKAQEYLFDIFFYF